MWDVDLVQFARLLDEINAIGLTNDQTELLAASMEVEPKDIRQLLNRATARWEEIKSLLTKKTPLTEDQVAEELAENGRVESIITMDFGEIIGMFEDADLESVIDDISERASTVPLENVDYKVLFADNDTLYIKVTGSAGDDSDDDDSDEENEEEESDVEPTDNA